MTGSVSVHEPNREPNRNFGSGLNQSELRLEVTEKMTHSGYEESVDVASRHLKFSLSSTSEQGNVGTVGAIFQSVRQSADRSMSLT